MDQNEQAQSYTQLKIDKPYIALNLETYISLCSQELTTYKRIGYEYYCKELFVVKSKSRFCCATAIYFNLDAKIIKENCNFIIIECILKQNMGLKQTNFHPLLCTSSGLKSFF